MSGEWPPVGGGEWPPDDFRSDVDRRLRRLEIFKREIEIRVKEGDKISQEFGVEEMKRSERAMLPRVLAAAVQEMESTKHRINRLEVLVSASVVLGFLEQIMVHTHVWPFING